MGANGLTWAEFGSESFGSTDPGAGHVRFGRNSVVRVQGKFALSFLRRLVVFVVPWAPGLFALL